MVGCVIEVEDVVVVWVVIYKCERIVSVWLFLERLDVMVFEDDVSLPSIIRAVELVRVG